MEQMICNAKKTETEKLLDAMPEDKQFECYDEKGELRRAIKENDNTVFVYGKRKRIYGRRLSKEWFLYMYEIKPETEKKSEEDKWKGRINRAIKCLSTSGLWPELLPKLRNMLKLSYNDKKEILDAFHEHWTVDPTPVYEKHIEKYPFMFNKKDDGKITVDSFYIFEMSDVTLKSMYFGKWRNDTEKANIKENLKNKKDYSVRTRTNYDVSFSYDAENNKAWYSEEYKDCGNGHYYLALDHNTAWFCEND